MLLSASERVRFGFDVYSFQFQNVVNHFNVVTVSVPAHCSTCSSVLVPPAASARVRATTREHFGLCSLRLLMLVLAPTPSASSVSSQLTGRISFLASLLQLDTALSHVCMISPAFSFAVSAINQGSTVSASAHGLKLVHDHHRLYLDFVSVPTRAHFSYRLCASLPRFVLCTNSASACASSDPNLGSTSDSAWLCFTVFLIRSACHAPQYHITLG